MRTRAARKRRPRRSVRARREPNPLGERRLPARFLRSPVAFGSRRRSRSWGGAYGKLPGSRRASGRVSAVPLPHFSRSSMISLQHVTKTYRNGVTALEDVSVEVEKGEFVF